MGGLKKKSAPLFWFRVIRGGVTVALLSSGKPYRLIRSLSFAVACYSSGCSVPWLCSVGDYAPHSLCSVVCRPSILAPSSGMMPQRETLCLPPVLGCRSASLLVGTLSLMERTTLLLFCSVGFVVSFQIVA